MINSHKVTKHACTSSWLPLAHSIHHTYYQVTVMGTTRVQIFQRPEKGGSKWRSICSNLHRESTPLAWLDNQFQQPSKPTKNANKWARMIHSVAALDKHVRLRQTKHRWVHFLEIKKIILSSFISLPWFVDKSSLVWAMAWCRTGDKPLP